MSFFQTRWLIIIILWREYVCGGSNEILGMESGIWFEIGKLDRCEILLLLE